MRIALLFLFTLLLASQVQAVGQAPELAVGRFETEGPAARAVVSSSGNAIAYLVGGEGTNATLWWAPLPGGQAERVNGTFQAGGLAIDGAGRKVAAAVQTNGTSRLVIVDLAKGHADFYELMGPFGPPTHFLEIAMSTDGKAVAGRALSPGNADQILRIDLPSGNTTLVSATRDGMPGNARAYNPSVSQDGAVIVFGSLSTNFGPGDGKSHFYRHGNGHLSPITDESGQVPISGFALVSQDGRSVLRQIPGTPLGFVIDGPTSAMEIGAPVSRQAWTKVQPAISANGTEVVYVRTNPDRTEGELVRWRHGAEAVLIHWDQDNTCEEPYGEAIPFIGSVAGSADLSQLGFISSLCHLADDDDVARPDAFRLSGEADFQQIAGSDRGAPLPLAVLWVALAGALWIRRR